jgi:hypothetical protein
MPVCESGNGRITYGFLMWMAGGGIKSGTSGSTDEIGYLTYVHYGRRFRLTEVAGTVIREILA